MHTKLLVNTAYFPPVQYLSAIKKYDTIFIEQFENYGKQSYRNRCHILSANGPLILSVPVQKNEGHKFFTRDAKIDYSTAWQKLHFKGIESAYKNSPFYEYYMDDLAIFFSSKSTYLLDFNTRILHTLLALLHLDKDIAYTEDFIRETDGYADLRNVIHPKPARRRGEDLEFQARPYTQTFHDRFPFFPNLSVLDLLFNAGPEANRYL